MTKSAGISKPNPYGVKIASSVEVKTAITSDEGPGSHMSLRDLLISFTLNYDVTAIYRTVHAFRDAVTGSQQHMAILVNLAEYLKMRFLDSDQVVGQG